MAKRADEPEKPAELTGLQSFTIERVHRSQLKNAPYNPRVLDEAAKRKLRAGIKRHGLVSPLTWNKRTGNIVGGHQRIDQMDALNGSPDYLLDVAVIDVDAKREQEINVLLNNANAQGDWELEALAAILKDPEVDIAGAGFDHADVFRMFGDDIVTQRDDPLDELAAKVREARDRYNEIGKKNAEKGGTDFYMVAVFRDGAQLDAFLKAMKLPDNRFQSGEEIMRLCGVDAETLEKEQKKSPGAEAPRVVGEGVSAPKQGGDAAA